MSTDFNFMFTPHTPSNGFFTSTDSDSESGTNTSRDNNGCILTMLSANDSGFEIFGGTLASLNQSLFSNINGSIPTASYVAYSGSESGPSTETIGSVAYAGTGAGPSTETIGSVACASVGGGDCGGSSASSGGGGGFVA